MASQVEMAVFVGARWIPLEYMHIVSKPAVGTFYRRDRDPIVRTCVLGWLDHLSRLLRSFSTLAAFSLGFAGLLAPFRAANLFAMLLRLGASAARNRCQCLLDLLRDQL